MLLNEFFGKPIDTQKGIISNKKEDKKIDNELFWFIIDHDGLHKEYFMPLAKKIKKQHSTKLDNKDQYVKEFMPMVKKGCIEFYNKKKMNGKLSTVFPKEFREDMCNRLYDHYHDDIIKDCYDLGLNEKTKWPFAGIKRGQKPGDMWKGTDKGPPGNKAFGGDA